MTFGGPLKRQILTTSVATFLAAAPAMAHYGMIIPSDSMISQEDP